VVDNTTATSETISAAGLARRETAVVIARAPARTVPPRSPSAPPHLLAPEPSARPVPRPANESGRTNSTRTSDDGRVDEEFEGHGGVCLDESLMRPRFTAVGAKRNGFHKNDT
jgi:hypothetical protein